MLKVPFPSGWVFTVTELANLRPIQHLLDAATDTRRCLRRLLPDRRQELDDHWRIDLANAEIAERLAGTLQRLSVLPFVLVVAVLLQVLGKVFLDAIPKRHLAGLFVEIGFTLRRHSRLAVLDGVRTKRDELTRVLGKVACLRQWNHVALTQAHHAHASS